MRISKMLLPTLREAPGDVETTSQKLMVRSGIIRKSGAGIYNYLPLGTMIHKKIQGIIRDEMEKLGFQEVKISSLIPEELYNNSKKAGFIEEELFRLKDRSGREYFLDHSGLESFIDIVKNDAKSYKLFPLNLYEMGDKYRDERRPRFGTLRSRAFTVEEGYSFDLDQIGLDTSYKNVYSAYEKIFKRLGLKYEIAIGNNDLSGGNECHEFIVKSDIGENEYAFCRDCGYGANAEIIPCIPEVSETEELKEVEKIFTPNARTIDDLITFLNTSSKKLAKTLLYKVDGKVIAVMVRGDREVNETKLLNLLAAKSIEMADGETVEKATNAKVGFAGPIGINVDMLLVDEEVIHMRNFIVGANDTEYHIINVNYLRDFKANKVGDLRNIVIGDKCPNCNGALEFENGIEVGKISKLGTKYSEQLHQFYIDENGEEKPSFMGGYAIGIDRLISTLIEQCNDENGIIWPISIAPFRVVIVPVAVKNEEQMKVALEMYDKLLDMGIETLLDDRDERAGVKFKDSDLLGIPIRITIGKKIEGGMVELKLRSEASSQDVKIEEILGTVKSFLYM